MSPERAKVFIAEDDVYTREDLKDFLRKRGHEVVLEAGTFEDAMASIEEAKEKGVNVALVDGSLALRPPRQPEHGLKITEALREAIPGIKVVSISSDYVSYTDTHVGPFAWHRIGEIVDEL